MLSFLPKAQEGGTDWYFTIVLIVAFSLIIYACWSIVSSLIAHLKKSSGGPTEKNPENGTQCDYDGICIFEPKIEEIRELIRTLDQLLGLPITKDRDEERIGSLFNELRDSPHTIWKDQKLEYLRYDYLTAVKKVSDLKDNFSKLVESDTQEKLEEAQDELSSIAEKLDKRISFVVQFFQRKN